MKNDEIKGLGRGACPHKKNLKHLKTLKKRMFMS